MVTIQLSISKDQMEVFPEIIHNYADFLVSIIVDFEENENHPEYNLIVNNLSIAQHLHQHFNNIERRKNKNNRIKLRYHEAILIYKALIYHNSYSKQNYSRNVASKLSTELGSQIPSLTQLKSIQLS